MSEGDTQLGHTSVRSVALSPSIISEITNQNRYLKNLWLQEQEQNNILKAKLLKLEKKIESISLLEASAIEFYKNVSLQQSLLRNKMTCFKLLLLS